MAVIGIEYAAFYQLYFGSSSSSNNRSFVFAILH